MSDGLCSLFVRRPQRPAMTGYLLFAVLAGAFLGARAFPNGAPEIACGEMVPGHLPTTTSGDTPFKLNISASTYKPGDVLTGSLYSDGSLNFKGFLIEIGTAADTSTKEEGVGEFVQLGSMMKHVCGKAGITHINNEEKQGVAFSWQAPPTSQGDLYVRATVVQKFFPSQYWTGSFSQRIQAASKRTKTN